MSTLTLNAARYGDLLSKNRPQPIHSEQDYDRMVEQIERLAERGEEKLSPDETTLLEMMSILIEEYDREHYRLEPSAPNKIIHFLMEQRGLQPRDLWDVLGSKSQVSEILNGKRQPSKDHAKKLAEFFHVPSGLFI